MAQTSCDDADAGYYVGTTAQSSRPPARRGPTSRRPRHPATTPTPATTSVRAKSSRPPARQAYQPTASPLVTLTRATTSVRQIISQNALLVVSTKYRSISCIEADIGHYVDDTGQSSQTECPLGSYQESTGQISCDAASVGHYVGLTGQSEQVECSLGTYQAHIGQSSCDVLVWDTTSTRQELLPR